MDQKLSQPMIISILAHACLILILLLAPQPKAPRKLQQIQVVYQSPSKSQAKQIVSDVNPPQQDLLKDLKKKVALLSALTRRVIHEQIARKTATKTVNGGSTRPPSFTDPSPGRPSITAPMGGLNPNQQLSDSTISDYIPDVRQGGFTSLNTDQFVYYTFYSRINEQIENRWVSNIQNIIYRTPVNVVNQWAHEPQVTQVEILLTPSGHFVRAILDRRAASADLDNAAISAFRLASPFNNPPSELVRSDGYIHLYYVFHINFRPRFLASDGST